LIVADYSTKIILSAISWFTSHFIAKLHFVFAFFLADRTRITQPPTAQNVTSPADVILTCAAETDSRESASLRVEWLRDGQMIASGQEGDGDPDAGSARFEVTDAGRRLRVRGSRVTDTGTFTCRATNGIDSESTDVRVTVRGKLGTDD
jgi:hypothetical protein